MTTASSPSVAVMERPPVAKRAGSVGVLKRQSSTRNLYKLGEKAAHHDAMMKKFNLRKMSSGLGIPTPFGRAVIDKAIGGQLQQQNRRFSLHRTIRSMTSVKTRQQMFQTLMSPITPKGWVSTIHGLIMLVIYHFQWIYLPVFACYFPHGSFATSTIAISLESFYLLHLLLNFNTAYVKQGVLVTSRRRIVRNYIRRWFLFDLLSAVPVQAIHCMMSQSVHSTRDAVRAIQITVMTLRLIRVACFEKDLLLARVMKIASNLTEWARYSRYSHLLGIAQLMWLVLLIAHYMACFWHVASRDHQLAYSTVAEQYIADYYYAISLIQGQGNSGGTWGENLYSSVVIITGSVILAIVFGNVAMLVSNFNANTTNYHRKMEAVYETMAKMDLPRRLRDRVNEYYKHVWLEYEALDGNVSKFQRELTHTLGIEVGLYKHMDLVVKVPFWKDCTPDFLTQIVLNLDVRVYMPDDYVVRRREIGSEMMMLNRGYCKLSKPSTQLNAEDGDTNILSSVHKTMFSSHELDLTSEMESHRFSDEEEEDSNEDEVSSDDEEQGFFGTSMFGSSVDSRRFSGNAFGLLDDQMSDFTDVRRFQNLRTRRPSYPNGTGAKKSKKYREYLHPGHAFGEMSLLMNYKRTANIRAIPFVEMCVLGRTQFQKIISRYPEDRRRVLTAMLESCIEKVIPFPWENIIEAVSAKRRSTGKKDISRASVIATMTSKEAARILVEAIDINAPDETIKYGFQSFDEGFIEDSSLRQANAADVKISDTLQRRRSSIRSLKSLSPGAALSEILDGSGPTERNLATDMEPEAAATDTASPTHPSGVNSDKTLVNLFLLVESMAGNIARLQQDVSDLKARDTRRSSRCECGLRRGNSGSQRLASPAALSTYQPGVPIDAVSVAKEEFQDQTSRKPSLVATTAVLNKRLSHRSSDSKTPRMALRKIRSKAQAIDDNPDQTSPKRESAGGRAMPTPRNVVTEVSKPDEPQAERYPPTLSGRSKAAQRSPTLSDMLWKRSNTSGDLLKHTDEERHAARLRRQLRTRRSMPTESGAEHVPDDGVEEEAAGNGVPGDTNFQDDPPRVASWLPRSQPSALNSEF